jgi:O-antigen/teichoic acid export membrane protein
VSSASDRDILGTPAAGSAAIRGGVLRVFGYGAGVLLAVGSAAVLFRHLGVEDSGSYVLVLSLVTLFGGITDAGLSSIGVRELAAPGAIQREHLLRNLLGLRIVFTGTGVLAACAYAAVAGYGRTLVLGTAIAGVGLLLTTLQSQLASVLTADLRLGWVTLADCLRQLVTALGIVALVLAGAELLPFYAVTAVAGAAALALTVWQVHDTPFRPALTGRIWGPLLRDTLPFALAAAVGAIYFRLGIVLVEALAGPEETGYYGASFRIVEVVVVVPQLALGAAFPIFSRAASDDLGRFHYAVQRSFDVSLLTGALVAIGLGVGASFAIEVVGGADFAPAAAVLRLHAVALAVSFLVAVFGYALLSLRRHGAVLAMNAAALVTLAVASAVLIPSDGARGAAFATVLSETVLALVGLVALLRTETLGGPLSLATVPRVAAAAAVAVGVPVALGLPSLPAMVLALALFCAGAVLLRVIPEELLVEARRLRP